MHPVEKSQSELLQELATLRQRVAELERLVQPRPASAPASDVPRSPTPLSPPQGVPLPSNLPNAGDLAFRLALQSTDLILFHQDHTLRYCWVHNPHHPDMAAAVLGKSDYDLFPAEEADLLTQLKQQVLTQGQPQRVEICLTVLEIPRFYDLFLEPVFDADAHVIGLACVTLDITQRKQVEVERDQLLHTLQDAIRQKDTSLALLNALLVSSPIGLTFLDRDLRYIHVNATQAQINGIPVEEHLGRTLQEVLPAWASYLEPTFRQVMETQTPLLNHQIQGEISATGVYRSVLANYYPVCLANGEVMGVGVTVMDVTSLKQTEDALRLSEQHYRSLAESLPQGVCLTQPDGTVTYCNQSWTRYTGLTLLDLQTSGWHQCIHPEDLPEVAQQWQKVLPTGQEFSAELRLRRHDGRYSWHLARVVPIRNQAQTLLSWLCTVTDIDHSKRTEQVQRFLAQASQVFAQASLDLPAVLDSITHLISELTQDLCVLALVSEDRKWLTPRSIGHPQTEIQAFTRELLQDQPRSATEGIAGEVFHSGQPVFIPIASCTEIRAAIKPEYYAYLERNKIYSLLIVPLQVNGQTIGTLGISRDRPNEPYTLDDQTLLQDVAERAAFAIANARLYSAAQTARAEAEAANRLKDEFLAILSHELRTPLNPILGWVKLLRTRQYDPAKTAYALETIERNAKLQAKLIEDLLDVSRILQGKLSLHFCPVDLIPITEAALETVQLAAEAKSIQVHLVITAETTRVLGDANRLQQVVWNLLSNAIKFTPEGGRVEVCLEQVTSSHPSLQMTVTDTGQGIHPDFLPYVFDSFRQADSKTTRSAGGLGLGLAIVRHLVELHGGSVQAASPGLDLGSTFTVRFPLIQAGSAPPLPSEDPAPEQSLKGMKLLVVDDELDNLELLAFILEQAGATVQSVSSSSEALQVFLQFKPDLLLSDIGMPGIDGYMLIHHIRALPAVQGGQIPAIAVTAYAGETDQQKILAAGFQSHITKPIDATKILEVVAQLRDRQFYSPTPNP